MFNSYVQILLIVIALSPAADCLRQDPVPIISCGTRQSDFSLSLYGESEANCLQKLADFWGPASNFGIPIAAVMDTQKDPEMYESKSLLWTNYTD